MDDVLDYNFPSIIRLLDVTTIGPYLVKHGVLQVDEYYNDYQSVLAHNQCYNSKLLPKLATRLKKYPQSFMLALEECVANEQCDGHQELLRILQDHVHSSKQVKRYPPHKRQYRSYRPVQRKSHYDLHRNYHSVTSGVSTSVNGHELYIVGSVSAASQEDEDTESQIFQRKDLQLVSEPAGTEAYKLERLGCKYNRKTVANQPKSELVYGGSHPNRRHSYVNDEYRSTLIVDDLSSSLTNNNEVFVAPEIAKPTSLESSIPTEMITFDSKCDDEITKHAQYNSEVNMYTSRSHTECEERYKRLKDTVSEVEQKFNAKVKELENYLEIYKSELERLHKQIQSNSKHTHSHCHVMVPKQTICYCYAQVGAHSHYVAENYNQQ